MTGRCSVCGYSCRLKGSVEDGVLVSTHKLWIGEKHVYCDGSDKPPKDAPLTAKEQHLMDVYASLGVKWGDDPFPVIAALRACAEARPSTDKVGEDDLTRRGNQADRDRLQSSAPTDGALSAPAPNQNRSIRFEIEAVQAETLRTFLSTHGCRPVNRAAVGVSPIEIVFRETSISMYCEARCTICKEKVDLNDYDSW